MNGSLFALLTALNLPQLVMDNNTLSAEQEECYATAMIGYDYVINSRAGLPIERALNTVSVDNNSDQVRDIYKNYLSEVVINAYYWQGKPHTYAVKVMHSCAFNQGSKSKSY